MSDGTNITEISLALSGQPHHHDSWGYRAPLDTTMTLDSRVAPCECTNDAPDNRPSSTRYESDQVRNALKGALLCGLAGAEDLGHFGLALIVKAIEQDGNLKVSVCTCGPWHPDMDGPDEDCPVHGRSYTDVWALAERRRSEADQARGELRTKENHLQHAESRARDTIDALRNLVDLKDGPRDEHYEVAKPMAWDVARMLVGSEKEVSKDTVGTDFHKTIQALIDTAQPSLLPSRPADDEVTLIVGPEGQVSQVIFHSAYHITLDEIESISQDIRSPEVSAIAFGPHVKVREFVVTRLPEDAETVIVKDL